MTDHLEHLAECKVCEAADEQDNVLQLVEFETDMLIEGENYNPMLTKLWDQEIQKHDLISSAMDETAKYYSDIDIELPPRPDTE